MSAISEFLIKEVIAGGAIEVGKHVYEDVKESLSHKEGDQNDVSKNTLSNIVLNQSCEAFKKILQAEGDRGPIKISLASDNLNQVYSGKIVETIGNYIFQEIGANHYVVHDKHNLSQIPAIGQQVSIQYQNGRADMKSQEINQNLQNNISR